MFLIRYGYFAVSEFKIPPSKKVYLSPRGLISILLFFQLRESGISGLENQPIDEKVLLIVIIFSMLIMIAGTLKKSPNKEEEIAFSITNQKTTEPTNTELINENDVPTSEE